VAFHHLGSASPIYSLDHQRWRGQRSIPSWVIFDRDKPRCHAPHVGYAPKAELKQGYRHLPRRSRRVDDVARRVIQASKPEPRIMRYELTDREWTAIKPMLPNKPRGVPRVNDRRVLNGIFWRRVA
jgi:hypothetical protein